jgi:thiamine biosynthesis lipoprotein
MFSRFQPESELSQLNLKRSIILSPLFQDVWGEVRRLYDQTNGAFNPLLSPVHLGYGADFNSQHQHFEVLNDDFNTDFQSITFDPESKRLSLRPGQALDFGGFLKGYATQKMAEIGKNVSGGIINLGGDITVWGEDIMQPKFELIIENPIEEILSPTVYIKNESLSTSGTYKRRWKGKHHILDAQTKDSSKSDLVSASVMSRDGAHADALATVAVALGSHKAGLLLDSLELRYVFIDRKGRVTQKI